MRVLHTGEKADASDHRYKNSGRVVRFLYSILVFVVIGYATVFFGRPYWVLEGVGTVSAPNNDVSVAFVSEIALVHVRPGDQVYPGSLLATVNRSDYDAVLNEVNTALTDREEDIDRVRRELNVAERLAPIFQRRVRELDNILTKTDARPETLDLSTRATLHREYSDASAQLEQNLAKRTQLPDLLAKLEKNRSQLRMRQAQVSVTWINRRLISAQVGTISSDVVAEGDILLAGDVMMRIFDQSRRYILWELPERVLRLPRLGEEVSIKTESITIRGQVDRFAAVPEFGTAAHAGGTSVVYVAIDEADFEYLPLQSSVAVSMNYFF